MTTLGEAWIEVHADTKPFNRELGIKIREAVKDITGKIEPDARKLGEKISQGVADGVDKDSNRIKRSFTRIGNFIDTEGSRWERSLRKTFTKMAQGNFILTRMFGSLFLALGGATKRIFSFSKVLFGLGAGIAQVAFGIGQALVVGLQALVGVSGDAARAASTLGSGFARIGAALATAAAEAVAAAPALAALAAVMVALTAVTVVLVGALLTAAAPFAALLNLALAIPAALGFLAVIIAPLVIAFHNLNDAIGLVFEKDPDKLAQGLKKLSPTLRGVVGILRSFAGEFKALGDRVQKAFFGPIMDQLRPTLDAVLPVLAAVFSRIATALGVMVSNLMRLVASRPFLDSFAVFASQVADFLEQNSALLADIFRALATAAAAALPVVLQLITAFTNFLTSFATWIEGAITDGRFERWLRMGVTSLGVIWNLVKALFNLFKSMFGTLNADGNRFLTILTNAINKFTTWANSKDGKQAIEAMGKAALVVAYAFSGALTAVQKILSVVGKIYGLWQKISGKQAESGKLTQGALSRAAAAIQGSFSGGGVVPYDQVAIVHQGEPILDPGNSVARNRGILADAGMLGVLSSEAPVVNVYIGPDRLDARIDYRVATSNRIQARTLASGPRS